MFTTREYQDTDMPALRALFLKIRQDTFTWLDTTQYNLSDFDDETAGEYILVAVAGDIVIGFISIWQADNFIHHLYVDHKHQNTGVGSALLKAAVITMDYVIRLKCLTQNLKAKKFYIRNGFIKAADGISDDGPFILFELDKNATSL